MRVLEDWAVRSLVVLRLGIWLRVYVSKRRLYRWGEPRGWGVHWGPWPALGQIHAGSSWGQVGRYKALGFEAGSKVAEGSHVGWGQAGGGVEPCRLVPGGGRDAAGSGSSDLGPEGGLPGLHVQVGGNFGGLPVGEGGDAAAEVSGAGGVVAGAHVPGWEVGAVGSEGLVGLGEAGLLLAPDFGVLDVDAVLVDVALLVVGAEFPLLVALDEDRVVVGVDCDVVVEFLDVLLVELVEEVDDQSAGHLVDLDPGGVDCVTFRFGHALGLITVHLEELLRLYYVEAKVVVLSDRFFPREYCFHRFRGQLVQEFLDVLLGGVFPDDGDDDSAGVLDIPEAAVEDAVSELGPQRLEVLVGLDSFLVGREGEVCPGASLLVDIGVGVDDVPVQSLLLHVLLDLVGEGGGVLAGVGLDALEMEDVGLVLLGVFVDLALGDGPEDIVVVDAVGDAVEDDLVLVFPGGVVVEFLGALDALLGEGAGLPDVADVEKDTGVAEGLAEGLGLGDGDLVDLNGGSKKRFDNPLNFLLEVLVVEIFGLVFLNLFLGEAVGLELEHHLGEVLADDGPGDPDLVPQDGRAVQGLLHVEGVVLRPVVDEGEPLRLLELGRRVLQPVYRLYREVLLDHCGCYALLEARHEDASLELVLLLLVVAGADGEGAAHVREVVGRVHHHRVAHRQAARGHVRGGKGGGRQIGWGQGGGVGPSRVRLLGVQLLHAFCC